MGQSPLSETGCLGTDVFERKCPVETGHLDVSAEVCDIQSAWDALQDLCSHSRRKHRNDLCCLDWVLDRS